jgi:hypothetical protein
MRNEGLNPEPEQEPQEDYSSWESPPSEPDISNPLSELYEIIDQDLWMGHARSSD